MQNKLSDVLKKGMRKFMRETQIDTDNTFLLEVNSDGNVTIKGITDINSFDEEVIIVSSDKFITEIKGIGLFMKSFSETEIIVYGTANTINFIKK